MKNVYIVTHNYAPLRSTFVQCYTSEVVGVVGRKTKGPGHSRIQNPSTLRVTEYYGIYSHIHIS